MHRAFFSRTRSQWSGKAGVDHHHCGCRSNLDRPGNTSLHIINYQVDQYARDPGDVCWWQLYTSMNIVAKGSAKCATCAQCLMYGPPSRCGVATAQTGVLLA